MTSALLFTISMRWLFNFVVVSSLYHGLESQSARDLARGQTAGMRLE